jgi:GntR family transcriptional regulator of vanillate catabolism
MSTRSQTVTQMLRTRVLEGTYLPGTHLQEIPLAAELQVSRTPVRAALAALEREGLLHYTANRGFVVREFGLDDIVDVYLVRAVLEGHGAALAARRGLDADASRALERCLADGDLILRGGVLRSQDLPAYRAMNRGFHEGILAASGSGATRDHVAQTRRIPFVSDRIILWDDYKLIERSHDDHHRIFHAVRDRDPSRAEAIMREHVTFMGQVVRNYLATTSGAEAAKAFSAGGAA